MKTIFKDIDHYISVQTQDVQVLLEQMRQTIKKAAPKAEEVISYNMPAFKYHGMLVYFAAYKNHIGFSSSVLYALSIEGINSVLIKSSFPVL